MDVSYRKTYMLTWDAVEYVTCKICKSPDTILDKENRLYFMTCESCGSRMCLFITVNGVCTNVLSRTIRVCDQDGFPGANWKEDQGGIRQRLEKGLDVLYVYYAFDVCCAFECCTFVL